MTGLLSHQRLTDVGGTNHFFQELLENRRWRRICQRAILPTTSCVPSSPHAGPRARADHRNIYERP